MTTFALPVLVVILLVAVGDINACGRKSCVAKHYHRGARPYYYGGSEFACFDGPKRAIQKRYADFRNVHRLFHRYIMLGGMYCEWFNDSNYLCGSKPLRTGSNPACKTWLESKPAGYTYLDTDCLQRCARNYRRIKGGYTLFYNNCHHFANVMAHVLCAYTTCPSWCR